MSELKSKIVKFERDFEAKNGRKPEKLDKIPIRAELKEYKRLKGTIRSPSCLWSTIPLLSLSYLILYIQWNLEAMQARTHLMC